MGDYGISERAKQIAAAAIEGKYGALDDGIDFDYGTSPETGSYGFKIKKIPINKKYMIIGGITLALVAVAVVGSIYLKKRQEKKP